MSQPPQPPPPVVPTGPSTPGGTVRPQNQNPVQPQNTIQTILHNLPNLFGMQQRGELSEAQLHQLRSLMHTHFRQVIASSMATGRPNPLLDLPPALDPTMPFMGRPPLISKEAYTSLVATTTQHLQETMARRIQSLQAGQAAQSQNLNQNSTLNQGQSPQFQSSPNTNPQPQQQQQITNQQQNNNVAPPLVQQQQQQQQQQQPQQQVIPTQSQLPQNTLNPNQAVNATGTPINRPNHIQIPQGAVTSAGMANQNQNQGQGQNPAVAQVLQQNTAGGAANSPAAGQPMKLPPGILSYNTMRELMKLSQENRSAWLKADANRISAFNISAKYWTSRTNATAAAAAAAAANNNTAGPSRATPPPQQAQTQQTIQRSQLPQQLPTSIAPSALLTPPIPPQPTTIAPSSLISPKPPSSSVAATPPAIPASTPPTKSDSTPPIKPKAIPDDKTKSSPVKSASDTKDTIKEPSGKDGKSAKKSKKKDVDTDVEMKSEEAKDEKAAKLTDIKPVEDTVKDDETAKKITNEPSESQDGTHTEKSDKKEEGSTKPSADATVPVADPALPSAIANPEIKTGTEFATALPDLKAFALKPPPPPPEPENVRRKRKCKEFIGELHPGLEMEYGMDEVIGDILDGLLEEGLKGATRLAKHRKSDKVELKDIAFFVDQCWGIENPGFDALGHTHRKTHIPPERERRRTKAVNPRAARLGRAREERANGVKMGEDEEEEG
ncbi:uncharacterized protein L201_006856 [Kwoniella dendrophila CBS 6074]|uniref:Transcription initiation factor TFIID subunit 12 domain-containing protein n=1 Tax=Kwoniella dendrophila CBS 6074 TaxID=1295534 RepID=A0AAX4K2B5_9TREE